MKVLIVGAGIAGATLARQLADQGHRVNVIDRRLTIGGNCYDSVTDGLRVHQYGPHLLHHSSQAVHRFLSRFTRWTPYKHTVQAQLANNTLAPLPINRATIEAVAAMPEYASHFDGWLNADGKFPGDEYCELWLQGQRVNLGRPPANSHEVFVSSVGEMLSSIFLEPYTLKHWGKPASEIEASVGARIPVRSGYESGYFNDKFQYLPANGYTAMANNMLCHPRISLLLGEPADEKRYAAYDKVYSSASIDEQCDYGYGLLPYRSIRFEHQKIYGKQTLDRASAVVNSTQLLQLYNRSTAWHLLPGHAAANARKLLTFETSCEATENMGPEGHPERYYPVRNEKSTAMYERYVVELDRRHSGKVQAIGRLGVYRYMDMAPTIQSSMAEAAKFNR